METLKDFQKFNYEYNLLRTYKDTHIKYPPLPLNKNLLSELSIDAQNQLITYRNASKGFQNFKRQTYNI